MILLNKNIIIEKLMCYHPNLKVNKKTIKMNKVEIKV